MDSLTFLINNRINGNSRLTSLAITDDQLTLASSDRNHSIDSLNAGLQRSIHSFNNAVSHTLNTAELVCLYWPLTVNRLSQSIHHAPG